MVLLDKLLPYLKARGHRVLIFSQMSRMLDILQDYLGWRGHSYERLDGSVRGEERYAAINAFAEQDTFVFLLSTRAGGVGLNLTQADTVLFLDSDWNPQNDLQAAARAHRIGQTRPVKIIRMVARSTVEEVVLARANHKLHLTRAVIDSAQFFGDAFVSIHSFSHSGVICCRDATTKDAPPPNLAEVLKFGVEKLLLSDDSSLEDTDLDAMLGPTVDGKWQAQAAADVAASVDAALQPSSLGEAADEEPESIYVFMGEDYKQRKRADDDAFAALVGS